MKKRKYVIFGVMAAFSLTGCNKKQLYRHRPHSKLQQQSLTTILRR